MTATSRTDCAACGRRIIVPAGGPPALDHAWESDPAGPVAARHLPSGAWLARWARPGEAVVPPDKRYRVHRCPPAA